MDKILEILHVVGAVFVVGPMAILPMLGMRAVRTGQSAQAIAIAKSTAIFSYISIAIAVFGFGLVSMADPKYNLTLTTPWVLASIILYTIAIIVTLALVVPALRRAAVDESTKRYPMIAAGSGVSSLLLVAVVVLMVWKP